MQDQIIQLATTIRTAELSYSNFEISKGEYNSRLASVSRAARKARIEFEVMVKVNTLRNAAK